jgi:hypothetical protein
MYLLVHCNDAAKIFIELCGKTGLMLLLHPHTCAMHNTL